MWSRRAVLTGLSAVAAVNLSACGFRPLYGRSGGVDVSDLLVQVEIGPIPDRLGQQLRNTLLEGLAPRGSFGEKIYHLKVEVTESISSLAVQKKANATRADLRLSSSFVLFNRNTGVQVFAASAYAVSSFNILNSEFATLMAEKGARDRAVRQLGDDIRFQTAIFLKSHGGKG
jgi:LPS-assembly lipoprotein